MTTLSERLAELSGKATPGDGLVDELSALHVWPQAVADNHADILSPRQTKMLYAVGNVAERAVAHITNLEAELASLRADRDRLAGALNTPEVRDFADGVVKEAAHQRERWGADHDAGKSPLDWFWLIGYLAQKAADAAMRDDADKALHHTISTAAALANWHLALTGTDNRMRPGIDARSALQHKDMTDE